MQDMHPHSSSPASGHLNASTLLVDPSLTMLNGTEPRHLHNVNTQLWELSYQSATAVQIGQASLTIPISHLCSPSQPIASPKSFAQQTTSITETPNEHTNLYDFASVSEAETTVSQLLRLPGQEFSGDRVNNPRYVIGALSRGQFLILD
jgi:hypothetical protein